MLSAHLLEPFKFELREAPVPEPGPLEVVIRTEACGICGTDYSAYNGRRTDWESGAVLGHEFAGAIARVGPGAGESVNRWREGDEVAVNPVAHCGECRECRLGNEHYCKNGKVLGGEGQPTKLPGGFAQYVRVPIAALYRKPEALSWTQAALTEPLAGSYKGIVEYSKLRPPETIVVIGVGAMGLLAVQVAHRAGAGRLIAADVSDFRLNMAREFGATDAIRSDRLDLIEAVGNILPEGPDVVFEAAGYLPAAEQAFALTRRGTRLNMFGVIVEGTIPVSPAKLHWLETNVFSSFSVTPRVFLRSLEMMERGLADPEAIVTHRFPLENLDDAMRAMALDDRVKIMMHF